MRTLAVIPARFASTRLAGKSLALIDGVPMIRRVYESSLATGVFDDVVVATDDARILDCITAAGGRAVMTRADHPSGTDRVAEVAESSDADVIVNVQGDLPFVRRELVAPLVEAMHADASIPMATIAVPIHDPAQWVNPNVVKIVADERGFALYFSRAPIPARRDPDRGESDAVIGLQHVGLYGYRREFLLRFTSWPPSRLEQIERLEQLRALERGVRIFVATVGESVVEVDTPQDLERASALAAKGARSTQGRGVAT